MRVRLPLLAIPLFLAASVDRATAAPHGKLLHHADAVPAEYIVVLADGPSDLDATIDRLALAHRGRVQARYSRGLRGFLATMTEDAAAALAADPDVAFVETNARVYADATLQANATWGIDRIDQKDLPLDTAYLSLADGTGATVYVFDTGIRATHTEFTGRIVTGYTSIEDGQGTNDCNQHGTHVAGTIAGSVLGVAKKASVVPVRVLGCDGSGSLAGILSGIDWVLANKRPNAVVNMSLGAPASDAEDAAIRKMITAGITVVVSAGNDNTDACTQSPARVTEAITVGATAMTDARAPFSNFGTCVDVFAPGVDIRAASFNGDALARVLSGTSQAAPHVAGAVALYQSTHPGATPAEIAQALIAGATLGKVTDPQGSPNRLLTTHFVDSVLPIAEITSPATGEQVGRSFRVMASATDANLTGVALAIDGVDHATMTEGPFTFELVDIAPGAHTLVLTATDAAAHTTTQTLALTVTGGGLDDDGDPATGDDDPGQTVVGGCSTGTGHGGWLVLSTFVGLLGVRRRRARR